MSIIASHAILECVKYDVFKPDWIEKVQKYDKRNVRFEYECLACKSKFCLFGDVKEYTCPECITYQTKEEIITREEFEKRLHAREGYTKLMGRG